MPIRYKIFEDRKLVYAAGEGKVTIDDLLRHIETLARDSTYVPPMKKLVDYSNAEILGLTIEELQKFTELKARLKDAFKGEMCAIVVKHDLDFGMARMHGVKLEPSKIETNVFRDIKSALKWLDVGLSEEEMKF
ncbi:MAG: hypothetical protein AB1805_13120 [Nitrospirota bacterium]